MSVTFAFSLHVCELACNDKYSIKITVNSEMKRMAFMNKRLNIFIESNY